VRPPCTDALEPNDANDPQAITVGELQEDLVVCTDKHDVYSFCALADEKMTVRLDYDEPLGGAIGMWLTRDDNVPVGSSVTTENSSEIVVDPILADSCYTLEVYVDGVGNSNLYRLLVSTETSAFVCGTTYEPNETSAEAVTAGAELSAAIGRTLDICTDGDVDFFYYDPGANPLATELCVTPLNALPDALDLLVWDQTGTLTDMGSCVPWPTLTDRFTVEVRGSVAGLGITYELSLN
jgi:hypothetical protein